jgi:polyphosphate kinase
MIDREVDLHIKGNRSRIILKMNALVDPETIKALYHASCAGVRIDLIVRGICCLKPGIPGISDNIKVISIIGRFLEHSRAYYFANGGNPELYLGSADIMPRNLDDRVETLFPVFDRLLVRRVKADLDLQLCDNVKSWQIEADGSCSQVSSTCTVKVNSQERFMKNRTKKEKMVGFKNL